MIGWLLKLFGGVSPLVLAVGIAVGSAAAGGSAAWWVQGLRLNAAKGRLATVQAAFDTFRAGVAIDDPLRLHEPELLARIVRAIIWHENGRCIYSDETITACVARALGTA